MSRKKSKIHLMVLTALMTAVICVLGPVAIAIPVSPVPISLGSLAVYFVCYILGPRLGTLSYLLYLLLGLAGMPVFSGYTGGAGKLFGPTGGYLIGFVFMALICGTVFERTNSRLWHLAGMMAGTAVCYLLGTLWLAFQANLSFRAALTAGVIPFIPGDLAKMILVVIAAPVLVKRLRAASLLD